MNTRISVHSYNELLLGNNLDECQIHDAKWKKAYTKVYAPSGSAYIMIWKKQNYRERITSVDHGGWYWLLEGHFKVMEMSYIWRVVVIAQLSTFFKTYKTACKFYLRKLCLIKTKKKHHILLNYTHNN